MRNHASSGSWLIQVQNFSLGGIYPNYLTREAELCRLVQSGSRPNLVSHNNLAKEGHKSTQLRHCAANIAVKNTSFKRVLSSSRCQSPKLQLCQDEQGPLQVSPVGPQCKQLPIKVHLPRM